MTLLSTVARHWHAKGDAFAMISVSEALGSTPREVGAVMLVSAVEMAGTIGGGRLEWDAINAARAMLEAGDSSRELTVTLGPAIGQCCGGRVVLHIKGVGTEDVEALQAAENATHSAMPNVMIYGAGHVGRALALALASLPFKTSLVDSREAELSLAKSLFVKRDCVTLLHTDSAIALAETAPAGTAHIIMTHSHALDSLIAAAVLERNAFSYLGIIGSQTKRTSFCRAFKELGLPAESIARIVCPIGGNSVQDKRPEVIAALVAAELIWVLLG